MIRIDRSTRFAITLTVPATWADWAKAAWPALKWGVIALGCAAFGWFYSIFLVGYPQVLLRVLGEPDVFATAWSLMWEGWFSPMIVHMFGAFLGLVLLASLWRQRPFRLADLWEYLPWSR